MSQVLQPKQAEDMINAHLQLGSDSRRILTDMQQTNAGPHYRMTSNEQFIQRCNRLIRTSCSRDSVSTRTHVTLVQHYLSSDLKAAIAYERQHARFGATHSIAQGGPYRPAN